MVEKKPKNESPAVSSFEQVLMERERLNRIIENEFKKDATILFTDISGYTEYIDRRGDIAGRALLMRHNSIVQPQVEKHDGKIIEIIGDAIMATFLTPLAAVKASVDIQKAIWENNKVTDPADRIHVKIGISTGEVLVDESAHYQGFAGDVANVAARIQSQTDPDQILISKTVYEQVCGSDDVLCRFHRTAHAKGKAQPLKLYKVVWQDEDIVLDPKPKLRPHDDAVAPKKDKQPIKRFQLEIEREGDHLKLSAYEQISGVESPIRHYEEIPFSIDMIEAKCSEMVDTLNKANRKGLVSREILVKLREIGQVLHDELFSLNVKEKIRKTQADYLSLKIDDQLVHLPWELLNDGRQFLCQRFNMGRSVKTRQNLIGVRSRLLARPLRMLILADPENNLKGAYVEGTLIRDCMDHNKDFINASLRSGHISLDFVRDKMRNFDIVHFAGHAEYNRQNPGNSGWRLTGGSLRARDITKMTGTAAMPALIFSNACQSARTEEWFLKLRFAAEIFGLANAFLLAGVKHYVGTFWEISDEPSSRFALEFYRNLFSDMTIGEAVRKSRLELIREYGEESIVWASYVLYGDPTFNYKDEIETTETITEPEPVPTSISDKETRTHEEIIDFGEKEVKKKNWIKWSIAASIVLLIIITLWGYPGVLTKGTGDYGRMVLSLYTEGNFKKAMEICKTIEDKDPKSRLFHVVRGNIYLLNGQLDEAEGAFKSAIQSAKGTELQKSEAFLGLGRIASIRKNSDAALKYYEQATESAPGSKWGYLSQALLLDDKKDYVKALDLLSKAQAISPQDQNIRGITDEMRKKALQVRDKNRQKRIDRLVKELLDSMNSLSRPISSDGWTSPPLTLWVMDFNAEGYSLKESQEHLIISGITDQLLQHSRAQLVERALFDKLIEELRLGSSKLIDSRTALSLGRLLASRIILKGQVVYSGPKIQVSMRLIETETGQISAAVNESFGSATPDSLLTEKLSQELLKKLKNLYPLRGRILGTQGEMIRLNIGGMAGVKIGQRFRVIDGEATLEVLSMEQDESLAKVADGKAPLQPNLRVEAI
jgi:class 3 adenylate cyclase/tetratricopeptide (TPR) repeat protein